MDSFDVSEHVSYDRYDEMLDDCYDEVNICGLMYSPSRALEAVDPVAYRCGFIDYCASMEPEEFEDYRELEEQKEYLEAELEGLREELDELEG